MVETKSAQEFSLGLKELPLILAGPILRRTEPDAVTVWVAVKEACEVTLKVYATVAGSIIGQQVQIGSRTTFPLGQFLHVVAITAKPIDSYVLQPGQIYAYDLQFGSGKTLTSVLNTAESDFPVTVSYFEHQLPTFALPSNDLNKLRIVHGSCRKSHGGGKDILPLLDEAIAHTAFNPNSRPHQLMLTGDQIYGDDVADPLLWIASSLGDTLLGWQEDLPLQFQNQQKPSALKPGQRTEIARVEGGLTAMLSNSPEKAKSHLFSLGEYYGIYLLAWSSIFFPKHFPPGNKLYQNSQQAKQWDKQVKTVQEFASGLWQVRRALANIPTYTICDDHDVTDDWYLNREWCNRVLSKPLGRRVVQNGMLAYAIFQAWGNTPKQFESGQPGEKLLKTACQWSASAGTDKLASSKIAHYLGIPDQEPTTGLPKLKLDKDVLILDRDYGDDTEIINWHYTIRSTKHEIVVLDTRTWRGYPPGEDTTAPPMLLSPTAFAQQIQQPITQTDQLKAVGKSKIEITLLVVPTNLISLSLIDLVQQWDWQRGKVFNNDVGDSWNLNQAAFSKLLATIFQHRDRLVILAGDIHYGCAVRLDYWSSCSQVASGKQANVLAQLTCSPCKNVEWKTNVIHTKVKSLVPEQPEVWAGWHKPPQLFEVVATPGRVRMQRLSVAQKAPVLQKMHILQGNWDMAWEIVVKDPQFLPDWQYQIEWIKRSPAQTVAWGEAKATKNQQSAWDKVVDSLLWFWRNRWLQEGEEVVGRNNLSFVTFEWSENESKQVIQDLYWYSPWHPTQVLFSRYRVPLDLEGLPPSLPRLITTDVN